MFSIVCKDIETLFSLTSNAIFEGWSVEVCNFKDGIPRIALHKSCSDGEYLPDLQWVQYAKSVGATVELPYHFPKNGIIEDWEPDQRTLRPVEEVELQKAADAKWADDVRQAWAMPSDESIDAAGKDW